MRKLKQDWDRLSEKKNLTGAEALKAVKQNGYALKYVIVQTPEICLESVKKNGYVLQYVFVQTSEICLEAVKQDGDALQYVSSEMFDQENEFTIEQLEALTGIMNLKIKK